MMNQLARGRPRVVAFDIVFRTDQPEYDPAFIEGMEALQAQGCKIILGSHARNEAGRLEMSPRLASQADGFGWVAGMQDDGKIVGIAAVVHHPRLPTSPSLAVRALAAWRAPDMVPNFDWRPGSPELIVRYSHPEGEFLPDAPPLPQPDTVTIEHEDDDWTRGMPRGADLSSFRAGNTVQILPEPAILSRHTISYLEIFEANEDQLRSKFEGKLVIVGDTRRATVMAPARPDWGVIDDGHGGRYEAKCYVHAVACADMLNAVDMTLVPDFIYLLIMLGLATIGLTLGVISTGRWRIAKLILAGAIVSLAVVVVSFAIASYSASVLTPSSLLCAFWFGGIGGSLFSSNAAVTGRASHTRVGVEIEKATCGQPGQ
jgi:CHASE2 domain-containing sensor protein